MLYKIVTNAKSIKWRVLENLFYRRDCQEKRLLLKPTIRSFLTACICGPFSCGSIWSSSISC